MKRREKFDYVLIETTGMADPGPVVQTFFVDDEISSQLRLDGIVTLVDAKHIVEHLDDSNEAKEQIAFADVVVLNKIDLVTPAQVAHVEARIRAMNSATKIVRAQNAAVDMNAILDLGAFTLARAQAVDATFLEPEYPFEWAGIFALPSGRTVLKLQPGPGPSLSRDTRARFPLLPSCKRAHRSRVGTKPAALFSGRYRKNRQARRSKSTALFPHLRGQMMTNCLRLEPRTERCIAEPPTLDQMLRIKRNSEQRTQNRA